MPLNEYSGQGWGLAKWSLSLLWQKTRQ